MVRKILVAIIILISCITLGADDTKNKETKIWTIKGSNSLLINQTSFSNWSGGSNNSVTGSVILDYKFNFSKKKNTWDTHVKLGYGLNYQPNRLDVTRKTEDYIDVTSIYGHKISKNLFFSFNVSFKTQFDTGYKYQTVDSKEERSKTSGFLAPAYLNFGPGIKFEKSGNFWVNFSPLNSKVTIVKDHELSEAGNFGVDEGKHLRYELGALGQIYLKLNLMKNISFEQKLQLFSNVLDKPQHVDFDYDASLNMKVNKIITVKAGITLKYDHDTDIYLGMGEDAQGNPVKRYGRRVQIKQTFGAGLNISF